MFERFTDRARLVMALANQEAQRFNHKYIGTEHIMLGLVKEGSGVGVTVLKNLNIDLRTVRMEVEKLVKSGPDMVTLGKLPQTPRAKKVIEYAYEESRNLGHNYVGTEHLLLGLLGEKEGIAAQILLNLGLKLEEVHEAINNLLKALEVSEEVTTEKSSEKVSPVSDRNKHTTLYQIMNITTYGLFHLVLVRCGSEGHKVFKIPLKILPTLPEAGENRTCLEIFEQEDFRIPIIRKLEEGEEIQ